MGRARRRTPRRRPSGLSRRDFLRRAGLASAALGALPLLDGCGDSGAPPGSTSAAGGVGGSPVDSKTLDFNHGVASGDPLADRVILWTRVTGLASGQTRVGYLVATDPALKNVVTTGSFVTDETRDYTVKPDVTGLAPATTYYYQFTAGGKQSPIGRTRTLPASDADVARMRLGVCVCSSMPHGFFNAYRFLSQRTDLDLFIHLGDYIYEYADGDYGTTRPSEPTNEIVSLADYRTRHAQYKRDTDLQALHKQHVMIAIWDDHEFADNAYKDGAVNHQPATEGDWQARVRNALQAYYEWMPTRPPDPSNLKKNYRSFQLGTLIDLLMLEERVGFRDAQLSSSTTVFQQTGDFADATRQLLGTTEEQWLFGKLRASTSKWRFIGQGVMFGQLKAAGAPNATGASTYINSDQWDGYDPARSRVLAVLAGDATHPKVSNTVILTGDIHSTWIMDISTDPNNPAVYNPATGSGALAVEFVCTSVTSPFVEQLNGLPVGVNANPADPHIKYTNLTQHGYQILDVTPARVQTEFWAVSTIATQGGTESFVTGYTVADGDNHLGLLPVTAASTAPTNPPPPAP